MRPNVWTRASPLDRPRQLATAFRLSSSTRTPARAQPRARVDLPSAHAHGPFPSVRWLPCSPATMVRSRRLASVVPVDALCVECKLQQPHFILRPFCALRARRLGRRRRTYVQSARRPARPDHASVRAGPAKACHRHEGDGTHRLARAGARPRRWLPQPGVHSRCHRHCQHTRNYSGKQLSQQRAAQSTRHAADSAHAAACRALGRRSPAEPAAWHIAASRTARSTACELDPDLNIDSAFATALYTPAAILWSIAVVALKHR